MSNGLVDELHEVPLDRENQDLKEIIEIAFQITAQLDIENVIKNVVWSFVSKFQMETVTVLLPGDMEESAPLVIFYRGVKREDLSLEPALRPAASSRSWTRTSTTRSPFPISATTSRTGSSWSGLPRWEST